MENDKILITGGAGFIGSYLSEELINNNSVTVIDDLSTSSKSNIQHLLSNKNFTFIKDTILNKDAMDSLIKDCSQIYHLAAAVGVQLIVDDPAGTIETNIFGTDVVLQLAKKYHKPVFIASTSEVYGKSNAVPFRENDDTVYGSTQMPRWAYAASKAVDEFLAFAYHKQFGLDIVIGRFFNTIGPRQSGQYGMVVPRFITAAMANEPVKIYGSGQQSRCFSYVRDVVKATIALMNCQEAYGKIFNIGSTEEITIEELADLIINLTDSKSEKQFISYEQAYGKNFDDMLRRLPCVDKLKNTIGFTPSTPLQQSIMAIINERKNN